MKKEKFPLGSPVVECLPGETRYQFKLVRDFVYLWEGDKDFAQFCVDLLEQLRTPGSRGVL